MAATRSRKLNLTFVPQPASSSTTEGAVANGEDTPLADIAALFERKRIKRVPVEHNVVRGHYRFMTGR
jgi:hypothetical protein